MLSAHVLPFLLTSLALLIMPAQMDWKTLPIATYPDGSRADITRARDAVLALPSAATVGELGLVLHAWEQFDLAAEAYAEARRLAPAEVDWWVYSGMLASRTAQHAAAARYFARAVALAPSPLLHLRLGDALLESGRPSEARGAYEFAVQAPEAEPAARYGLGRVALTSGENDVARTQFSRAVALVPAFGAAHYGLAQLQRKAGDLTAARASLERQQACLACWPMPPDRWDARLAGLRTDAAALLRRGVQVAGSLQADVDAIRLHEDALARDPALGQARVNLISLYARTGNLEKAQAQYRAVVAAGTHLADAHHALGLALAAAGDSKNAEPVLRKAVQSNPFDAAAHNALGLIDEAARRVPEAEASYVRAVDADPRVRAFRFNYARVLANTGRLDEALAQLLRLHVPDDAESARYMYATSALYARKGDLGEARRLGTEALARARRHGALDLAAALERDLRNLR